MCNFFHVFIHHNLAFLLYFTIKVEDMFLNNISNGVAK